MTWGQWFVIGAAALGTSLLLTYEAYALLNKVGGDTSSEFIWAASNKYPMVPFLFGLVVGHFFWTERCP